MIRRACSVVLVTLCFVGPASADVADAPIPSGISREIAELALLQLAENGRYIKAREEAEAFLEQHPDSYAAMFVLGTAYHYGEANFPKALYYQTRALELFEERFGAWPAEDDPWHWHSRMLSELAWTSGALDQYEEQLRYMALYNERYTPKFRAERAWPLMKLRRFDAARLAAQDGLASGESFQVNRALNSLCAIEFEAGDDKAGYEACERATEFARQESAPNSVDLSNQAEAARSLFRLGEAERLLVEATQVQQSAFGNPWMDLAALYMRGARFAEALGALREIPQQRALRPAHARDADRNEARRSLTTFLLLMGRPEEALRITERALVLPDRRAHVSRDPVQDQSIIALLDRRARLMQAEIVRERACAKPFYQRVAARVQALWLRLEAWMSGRRAATLIADHEHLLGVFAIGTARSAVLQPFWVGDFVPILGEGVTRAALAEAKRADDRPGADAYYAAVEAEAFLESGDQSETRRAANRALAGLGPGEALLRARTQAVLAETARRQGEASPYYEAVLQVDPGAFRRLGWPVPVKVSATHNATDARIAKALLRSPRFEQAPSTLTLQVADSRACLLDLSGSVIGCSQPPGDPDKIKTSDDHLQHIVESFHQTVFAPRVALSQTDINGLDGSNRVTRDPLQTLLTD